MYSTREISLDAMRKPARNKGRHTEEQHTETLCHCHGHLTRLLLDSFLYFAKSNSSPTLVDLIFLPILSIHVIIILSYPSPHIHCLTSLIFLPKHAGLFYDVMTG